MAEVKRNLSVLVILNMDSNLTLALAEGETLLHRLLQEGAELAHDCGGKLACASCLVVVRKGRDALSEPSEDELDMLDRAGVAEDGARLSCQVTGAGEVALAIPHSEAPPSRDTLPVALSADAARFLEVQLAKHPGAVGIRLAVEPSGCSGLRYRVDPVAALRDDDVVFSCNGVRVAVDPVSLPFVHGTTVLLAQEGLARRLRFDNPNARQTCGCGESFGAGQ